MLILLLVQISRLKQKETCIGLCKKYQNLLLIRKDSLTVITNFESKWKVTRRGRCVFSDVNTSKKQTCGSSHLALEQSGSTIDSKLTSHGRRNMSMMFNLFFN